MGFAEDLKKICDRAGDKAELVVRRAALDIGGQLVDRSPVDTGRFKNNWQTGIGGIDKSTSAAADLGGAGAMARLAAQVAAWKPGQSIFVSNSLVYAYRLETGWSKQAPSGIVRLTVQNFEQAVAKAAKGLK